MKREWHCTRCWQYSGPVVDDCCSCCKSQKRRDECTHLNVVPYATFDDDPPEWLECTFCGKQWDVEEAT